ncbi:MAG: hypothetical protein AAF721_33215 [Myxococcota bacterium]
MRLESTLKSGTGAKGRVAAVLERVFGFRFQMGWVQMHRPAIFGEPFHVWLHGLLRGPSTWSPWERELFASFTARQESCPF